MLNIRSLCARVVISAFVLVSGCRTQPSVAHTGPRAVTLTDVDGSWTGRGISYGPHRAGQAPWGEQPTKDQIREDLRILDPHFDMLRMYGTGEATEYALQIIREDELGLRVMLGAWLDSDTKPIDGRDEREPDAEARRANQEQIDDAIRLANAYPDVVFAINVGNETQVFWTGHPVDRERLIGHLRRVRAQTRVPVTTADDFNFWNKPESDAVAAVCDFIGLHAYAMWNGQQLDDAVGWTAAQVADVRAKHPGMPIILCETGWATRKHTEGEEAELIKGTPGEAEQARFYREFTRWAHAERLGYFFFEAFDEPWKGPEHPDAVEKHWGLWHESREPKAAIREVQTP